MEIKKISEKIIFPASIVVSMIVLAVGFYAVQNNKQQSIERQQILKLQEERMTERIRAEQEKKEFIAKRKTDCLDIYKTEINKWNNTQGWRYDEDSDLCYIIYKEKSPKSDVQCEKEYDDSKKIFSPDVPPPSIFMDYLHCVDGTFEKSF